MSAAAARQAQGLTLKQAAKRLRLSERTVREYEAGRGQSFYQARRIARLYKCSLFGCLTRQGISVTTK